MHPEVYPSDVRRCSVLVKVISGVLVRLTTCKRLTNSSPKLSLITLSLPERRDSRSAEYTGGPVIYPSRFIPWGTRKSIFQVRHGENLKSLLLWMVGIEPTTQKTHVLPTTPFVKVISGVLIRLTTCKRLTNSSPKLSLITYCFQSIMLEAGCQRFPTSSLLGMKRCKNKKVSIEPMSITIMTQDHPSHGKKYLLLGRLENNRTVPGINRSNTYFMCHAACKVEFQPFNRPYSYLTFCNFFFKTS